MINSIGGKKNAHCLQGFKIGILIMAKSPHLEM
jgi:hypothetical protein